MAMTGSDRRPNRGVTRYLLRSLLFLASLALLALFFENR